MRDVVAENRAKGQRAVGLYQAIPQDDGSMHYRLLETTGGYTRETYTEEVAHRWIESAAERRGLDTAELFLIFDCFAWQAEAVELVPGTTGTFRQRIERTASRAPARPEPARPTDLEQRRRREIL